MIRGVLVGALALVSACFSPSAHECVGADGVTLLCAANAACGMLGSSATCELPGEMICGDGVVGSGEVCDDGNTIDGDGCSADCRSRETCGNGIVDTAVGEQCDDGNVLAHDGCSSRCLPEQPHWVDVSEHTPRGRSSAALAYDASDGHVVMFGGFAQDDNAALGDTWLWRGAWHQAQPLASPAPRSAAAIAYAGVDGDVYLYGGLDSGNVPLAELWRWDGTTWTYLATTGDDPMMLASAAMAYDAHRGVLVLFGGDNGAVSVGSGTWELDPATLTWTSYATPAQLMPREGHAMAYDPIDGYILLFGGVERLRNGKNPNPFNDTWVYRGAGAWTQVTGPVNPPASEAAAMGFDGSHLVLTTGITRSAGSGTDDAISNYTWDGAGSQWVPTDDVSSSAHAAVAFDGSGALLRFGGDIPGDIGRTNLAGTLTSSASTDLWTDASAAWTAAPLKAVASTGAAATLDLGLGIPIISGGYRDDPLPHALVLGLVDNDWQELSAGSDATPLDRGGVGAAYDESQLETIFFGEASQDSAARDQTWSWKRDRSPGSDWQQEMASPSPDARVDHAMAYDAARARVVLFGGAVPGVNDAPASLLADTWEWDGAARTWTKDAAGAVAPSARMGAAIAYDRVRQEVVLFGGQANIPVSTDSTMPVVVLGDTWIRTGSGWAASPARGPSARVGAAMGWDPARERVVLFGGKSATVEDDTWEWDGAAWVQVVTLPAPGRVRGTLFGAADGIRLYGGGPTFEPPPVDRNQLADIWLFRYDGNAPSESCRDQRDVDGDGAAGCKDPDCWLACTPLCPPGTSCMPPPGAPFCGDGACGFDETPELCPTDCVHATVCGDGLCTGSGDCPGDCP